MTIKNQPYYKAEKKLTSYLFLKIKISRTKGITILVLLFFAGNSSDTFAQTWYSSSWAYRKSHVVNAAAGAGNNYQVPITVRYGIGTDAAGNVYCSNLSKTDFTDIRFTAADGTTLLSHWIQSFTASNNAVFWVKIPTDLSITNQTIYMYYGNASATNTSSGIGTFIYYDDGSTTAGWTTAGSVASSGVQGNPANSLRAAGASGSYLLRNTGIGPNTFTFFNVRTDAGNLGNFFFQCSSAGLGQMYRLDSRGTVNYSGFATTTNWTTWTAPAVVKTSSANTWYQFGIAINGSGTSSTLYYDAGTSTNPVTGTALGTYATTNSGNYVGLVGDGAGSTLYTYWDNIITRKYVSPEPANSTWGVQEALPTVSGFLPANACPGATGVIINGTNFTGVTAVSFNGVPAIYTANNATQITATVPYAATTGIVSVTTPAGTGNSSASFTVKALPVATASNPTNITCNSANDGTITVTGSGGSGSYIFSVDGINFLPPTGTNMRQFTGLHPNTPYHLQVKDNNGCISK